MKVWKQLAIGFVILVVGIIIGRSCVPINRTLAGSVVDTTIVLTYKEDTSQVYDTIPIYKDTFFVVPTTPIGEIPVRTKDTTTTVYVDIYQPVKHRISVPLFVSTTYRGILYNNKIRTVTEPFEVTFLDKKPVVDLFGGAFAYVNQSYRISGEIVGGMRFFDHYAIIGKAELDHEMNGNLKLGVGYVF